MTEVLAALLFPVVMLMVGFFVFDPIIAGVIRIIIFIREATRE